MLEDLAEGQPVAHKSTSEGGEYNIYVRKGSVYWRKDGGSAEGGGVGKKYYWITMDRDYIEQYINYASRMNNVFEGEIYTQAPNKVAFDTKDDMFAFTSMIENHNEDNYLEEGDEEYIHYEELFGGEPRENIFGKISSKNYATGGEISYYDIYDDVTNKTFQIKAYSLEQAEGIADTIDWDEYEDGERIDVLDDIANHESESGSWCIYSNSSRRCS
jgi:hypothetical protein